MKLKSKSYEWQVMSDERNGAARVARHSSLATRHSRSGIALVITLILLSVTLVMAVAFLAIARRERNSVTTTTDTATARLATDSALAAAQAQIVANILSTTNPYNYSLLVSTNYISGVGYDTVAGANLTNVSYNYPNGISIVGNDLIQNIANLYLLPRAPVFVYNRNTGTNDVRYYLDLNRNGQFETNNPPYTTAGDPEWIGILERPDQPHSPNNKFVARYAFFAQPVGNGLDLNFIHNQVLSPSSSMLANIAANDGYFRNEGVGTWELNLAAFLADLNTNQWNPPLGNYYQYNRATTGFANSGNAFYDAGSLLAWRYGNNFNTLATPWSGLLNALAKGNVDGYTLGPLMTTTVLPTPNSLTIAVGPWDASDNTNRFFALPSELFDATKSSSFFVNRLAAAGSTTNLYDRYTFYRMFDQLGTDSTVDDARMNLNYDNLDAAGNVIAGAETNCTAWTPLRFFTNAANVMLQHYTANWRSQNFNYFTNTFGAITTNAFGVTAIPVYVNDQFVYTPAVNRLLQLAANMYDATTNSPWPSVFRPMFTVVQNGTYRDVFITGYNYVSTVSGPSDPNYFLQPADVATVVSANLGAVISTVNIYGVPWIIGAKKGLPNFNEFSMENNLSVTRRLQLTRQTNASPSKAPIITSTNQMYMMSLNSSLGIELWNSYANNYPGTIIVGLSESASLTITNDDPGFQAHPGVVQPMTFSTNNFSAPYQISSWTGAGVAPWFGGNPNTASFRIVSFTGPTLTNSVYRSPSASGGTVPLGLTAPCFIPTNYFGYLGTTMLFESNSLSGFHLPQFGVVLTNRLQVFMLDLTNGVYHVIDYVHFAGPDGGFNVNAGLADADADNNLVGVWDTNDPSGSAAPAGPTYGILNQIAISKSGAVPGEDGKWNADPQAIPLGGTKDQQVAFFQAFFKPGNKTTSPVGATNMLSSMEAPYAPTRYIVQYLTWQVNDPLVHYLGSDIDYAISPNSSTTPSPGVNHYNAGQIFSTLTGLNLGRLNDRFMPWGSNPTWTSEQIVNNDTNNFNLAERDPLMTVPDKWDFPTGKLPTIGWLGRIHRGTSWQTVYLKASDFLANNNFGAWQFWTGNGNVFDATNSAPVADRDLFDLFSTALSGNATHGTLSINQTHLASWSALFSGVVALTNMTDVPADGTTPVVTNIVISPAGTDTVNSAISLLLNGTEGINATRAAFTNADGLVGAFEHLGDILRVPSLTEQSPFINHSDNAHADYDISDELYEWLPQQTLGLLRASSTPRFVIYCYGQTLRPARDGLVTSSGNQFGLCTNYQVTAESAARVVLRVDNAKTSSPRIVIESFNTLPPN